MGINISVEGRLDDPARLPELLRQCRERCTALGWTCEEEARQVIGQVYSVADHEITETDRPGVSEGRVGLSLREIDTRVTGLIINPPDTGSLSLTFEDSGRLVEYREMPGAFETPKDGFGLSIVRAQGYWLETPGAWIATTGAVETHIRLIELLRWLQSEFMSGLVVHDSGGFWDTGDPDRLESAHRRTQSILGLLREPEVARAIVEDVFTATGREEPEPAPKPESESESEPPGRRQLH